MKHFSKEQMQKARKTNLYDFLLTHHANEFIREGNSIHPVDNHSLSIKRGYCGYMDFATNEKGNSVDFLVNHLDYAIDDAVFALIDEPSSSSISSGSRVREALPCPKEPDNGLLPDFPPAIEGNYKNLFAYLIKRGISQETIQMLIDQKLMYQEKSHNNIVFVNRSKNWGEIHGTYTQANNTFHGMIPNCRHDGFWSFSIDKDVQKVYICEAAIDAISLYEIHRMKGQEAHSVYVSIGGVAKQPAIDRIKRQSRVIMAVDNDDAGSECRRRNPELESIIPLHKDWNDDLRYIRKQQMEDITPSSPKPIQLLSETITTTISATTKTPYIIDESLVPKDFKDPFNDEEHGEWMKSMFKYVHDLNER